MSNGNHWMPLYVADYLGDTMHLTTLQHGAYVLLLMHYWKTGPLPDDHEALAAITKLDVKAWKGVWAKLSAFFTANGDGTLHQKRMDKELRRWEDLSSKRSIAGKLGGAGKHHSNPTVDRPPTERVRRPYDSQTKEQNALLRVQRLAEARVRGTHSEEEWRALLQVCGHRCLRCGGDKPGKDHIVSLYLGGSDAIENLQPLCRNCNASKGPDTTDLRPPEWREIVANAKQTPSKTEANAKQLVPISLGFASPPVPVQKKEYVLSSQEECAREAEPGETGKDLPREQVRLPSDALKELMASLPPLPPEPDHPKRQDRNHTLDVQRAAVAKPQRSKACYITGPALAVLRKQAGIWVAP